MQLSSAVKSMEAVLQENTACIQQLQDQLQTTNERITNLSQMMKEQTGIDEQVYRATLDMIEKEFE